MNLVIPLQKPVDGKINASFDLTGFAKGEAVINLDDGTMVPDHPVDVKPYEDNGRVKTVSKFKVEGFTLKQIKGYLF